MLTALNEEWRAVSKLYLEKLINGTPERLKDVIANKGGHTQC
jgi:hypothetical protein